MIIAPVAYRYANSLLLYTYGNFFALPYTGMYFIESSGRIVRVYLPSAVQPGDELVQVGAVRLDQLHDTLRDLRELTGGYGGPHCSSQALVRN